MDDQWMWQHLGAQRQCVEQCGEKWQPQSVSQQTVAAMQEGGCHKDRILSLLHLPWPASSCHSSLRVSQWDLWGQKSVSVYGGAACSSNCKGLCPCLWPLEDSTPRKERQMEETWACDSCCYDWGWGSASQVKR